MRGGSLTRYHTPVLNKQEGKGLAEDLIKLAAPLVVQQAQAGLQDIQQGLSLADTLSNRGERVGKNKAKRTAKNTYKRTTQRVRDIFGL